MVRILLSARLGERKLTQADLARMTQIRPSTINDLYWEMAERVKLEHLELICEALDCELSELVVIEKNGESQLRNKTGYLPRKRE